MRFCLHWISIVCKTKAPKCSYDLFRYRHILVLLSPPSAYDTVLVLIVHHMRKPKDVGDQLGLNRPVRSVDVMEQILDEK